MGAPNEKVTEIYHKANGETLYITDGLSKPEKNYLRKVEQAAADPTVDEIEVAALVWNTDNPYLQIHPDTGAAIADRAAYDSVVFQIMLDLIDQKRINLGTLDPEAAAARYTLTVKEAADKLGIHAATVRKAIDAKRLAAWKRGGTYMLDPASVASYKISNRGARADVQFSQQAHLGLIPGALAIREGTDGDYFLRVRGHIKSEERQVGDDITQYLITRPWERVAVQTGKKSANSYRLFILEPAPPETEPDQGLTFAGFYVRGAFKVVEKINNSKEALAAWKAYDPPAPY